jgi:hypothetical protein
MGGGGKRMKVTAWRIQQRAFGVSPAEKSKPRERKSSPAVPGYKSRSATRRPCRYLGVNGFRDLTRLLILESANCSSAVCYIGTKCQSIPTLPPGVYPPQRAQSALAFQIKNSIKVHPSKLLPSLCSLRSLRFKSSVKIRPPKTPHPNKTRNPAQPIPT